MKFLSTLSLTTLFLSSIFAQADFGAIIEGPLLIEDTPGHIIMKAGDGSYWTLTVDPSGLLKTTAATFTDINVTISNSQTYTKDVSVGDEEGVSIFQQTEHYSESQILFGPNTNFIHRYTYTPASNYVGPDQVTLLASTGSDGASPNTDFEYITIRFTVTN